MTAIKTITTHKMDYMQARTDADFTDVTPTISSFTEFDEQGHTLTEITYFPSGEIEHKCESKYNDKGLLIEEVLINDEGAIDERKKFEYNDKDQVIKEFLIYQDESSDTTTYSYDDAGRLIEKVTLDPDGEFESKKEFVYENQNLVKETVSDADQKILRETCCVFDAKGNEIEITEFDAEDGNKIKTEFIYNEEGKRTESLRYNFKGEAVSQNFYKEDEKGQLIEIIEQTKFSKSITQLSYDDKGNMIDQLETNKAGELISRISRTFNEDNNLVEVAVTNDRHGMGLNQNYVIQYQYEYFS